MVKALKCVLICGIIAVSVGMISLIADREQLNEGLIRFHVIANSDSESDQKIKLQVRDAVLNSLQWDLQNIADIESAKEYLRENLSNIQRIANEALQAAGFDGNAVVTLCKETFGTRSYDTFTLPAGVYESLRIVIGEGDGHNWWCVSFPTLCIPATTEGFEDAAVGAGFSETLTDTLLQRDGYEIRFFILDVMGNVQNILFE